VTSLSELSSKSYLTPILTCESLTENDWTISAKILVRRRMRPNNIPTQLGMVVNAPSALAAQSIDFHLQNIIDL
jgi:hypothetical protein